MIGKHKTRVIGGLMLLSLHGFLAAQSMSLAEALRRLASFDAGGDRTTLRRIEVAITAGDPVRREYLHAGLLRVMRDPSATTSARQFAADQLALSADVDTIGQLMRLLRTKPSELFAAQVLAAIPGSEATAAMRAALDKTGVPARIRLVAGLGARRDADSVPLIAPFLKQRNFDLLRVTARALARIDNTEASNVLRRALRDALGQRREEIATALMGHAHTLVDHRRLEPAIALFREFTRNTEVRAVRLMAYRGLARARGAAFFPTLAAALLDRDDKIAQLAAQEIPRLKGLVIGRARSRELADRVRNPRRNLSSVLLEGFIRRGKPDALEFTRLVLRRQQALVVRGQNIDQRTVALRALAALGGAAVIPELVQYLAAGSRPEVRVIQSILVGMSGAKVDYAIAKELIGDQILPLPRLALVHALGRRHTNAAAFTLADVAAKDTAFGVRLAALRYLAVTPDRLDTARAVKLLAGRMTAQERRAAETLLVRVASASRDRDAQSASIEKVLRQAGAPNVHSMLRVLAGVGGARSLRVVSGFLSSTEAELRLRAVAALSRWVNDGEHTAVARYLLTFARQTQNLVEHVAALSGYFELVGDRRDAKVVGAIVAGLRIAKRVEEELLAIRLLAESGRKDALPFIRPYLDATRMRSDAATAIVHLVETLKDRQGTAVHVRAVVAVAREPQILRRARALLDHDKK